MKSDFAQKSSKDVWVFNLVRCYLNFGTAIRTDAGFNQISPIVFL